MYDYFFFNDTATTEIYTLSLHDALPIYELNVLLDVEEEELKKIVSERIAETIISNRQGNIEIGRAHV